MRLSHAVILAASLGGAPAFACAVPDEASAMRSEVIALGNEARSENGQQTLEQADKLAKAAQDHACWMAETGNFSHSGKNGSTIADRARAAGYNYRFIAENIAFGQEAADQVVSGWMESEGHRQNLLSARATEIGIGIAANDAGRIYWVMSLGQTLSQ
ncbi:CAP domain-containing protein [Cribrihabitans sp. XS_ASV171]